MVFSMLTIIILQPFEFLQLMTDQRFNISQPSQEQPSRELSLSRMAQQIQEEYLQEVLNVPNLVLSEHQQKSEKNHFQQDSDPSNFMSNVDGPAIKIHYSNNGFYNEKHQKNSQKIYPPNQQNQLKQDKEPIIVRPKQQMPSYLRVSQFRSIKESTLKSIQENDLEYRKSDDEIGQPRSMLESKIVNKMLIQSISSRMEELKRLKLNNMITTMRRSAQTEHNNPNEVYIRAIEDSNEIDLENHADDFKDDDLHTLRMAPNTLEKPAILSKSVAANKGLLSSLVTLSKKKKQMSNPCLLEEKPQNLKSQNKKEQIVLLSKIQSLEKLIRDICDKKKPQTSLSKSNNNQPSRPTINEPLQIQGQKIKWDKMSPQKLKVIYRNQIWIRIPKLFSTSSENRQLLMLQVLELLKCSNQARITQLSSYEVIAYLPFKQIALLTHSSFFIGRIKEIKQKVSKYKGLEVCPHKFIYSGEYNCDVKSGQGTILYQDSSVYSGTWLSDKYEGVGILTSEGDVYSGDFSNGLKMGKGKQTFERGDSYHGNYQNNMFHGEGYYEWANGSNYTGQFKQGKLNGHGHWKSSHGEEYIGQFIDSVKQGWGIYKWRNGRIYEGHFVKGSRMDDSQEEEQPKRMYKKKVAVEIVPVKYKTQRYIRDYPDDKRIKSRSFKRNHSLGDKFRIYFRE